MALTNSSGTAPTLRFDTRSSSSAAPTSLRAEIDNDPAGSREAALASRATHFGLYRLGCDGPQLDALYGDPAGESAWRRQVEMCRGLAGDAR